MSKEEAQKEYAFKSLFEPIDPNQDYFYYPEAMCTPDLTANPENDLPTCEVALDEPTLLLSRDGGTDLYHLNVDYKKLASFLESLVPLFDGLTLLHRGGVVHLDIKPLNVVSKINANGTFTTRYIDLGLSKTVERAIVDPPSQTYAYWPFDVRLLNPEYLSGRIRPSNSAIERYYKGAAYNNPIFPVWLYCLSSGLPITESWAELLLGKIRSRSIAKERIVTGVDVFSLGRTLAEVYTSLTHHYFVEDKKAGVKKGMVKVDLPAPLTTDDERNFNTELAQRVTLPIYDLVAAMINPNPDKRITAEEAAVIYKGLLPVVREVLDKWHGPPPAAVAARPRRLAPLLPGAAAAAAVAAAAHPHRPAPPPPVGPPIVKLPFPALPPSSSPYVIDIQASPYGTI